MKPPLREERFVSRHRFVLLFGILLGFYMLVPVLQQLREELLSEGPAVVEGVLFLAVILGTIVSVSKGRAWIPFALLLGLAAAVLWVVGVVVESEEVALIRQLVLIAFLGYAIWVMLRAIFDSRQVTFNTVCASLCVYLLLGLVGPGLLRGRRIGSGSIRLHKCCGATIVCGYGSAEGIPRSCISVSRR